MGIVYNIVWRVVDSMFPHTIPAALHTVYFPAVLHATHFPGVVPCTLPALSLFPKTTCQYTPTIPHHCNKARNSRRAEARTRARETRQRITAETKGGEDGNIHSAVHICRSHPITQTATCDSISGGRFPHPYATVYIHGIDTAYRHSI